jgi:hypothetical protein
MRASLYRKAPIRPHGDKQVMPSGPPSLPWQQCQVPTSRPGEVPLAAADIAHDATDMLADPLVESQLPRHRWKPMLSSIMAKWLLVSRGEPTCACRRGQSQCASFFGANSTAKR